MSDQIATPKQQALPSTTSSTVSRRTFIKSTIAASTALAIAPAIHTSARAADEIVIGEGAYKYRVQHNWVQLPDQFTWQTTHNVAVDADNNL